MDDSEGNRSLTLNDAMGGGSNHTANTETFANDAQVRALGIVLEGSAGDAMDADMLAKQQATLGRVSTTPAAHAVETYEESIEFFTAPPDLDFEMSSTTRFAQMGQQMALEGLVDVDALDLAKQRARAGVGPDRSVTAPQGSNCGSRRTNANLNDSRRRIFGGKCRDSAASDATTTTEIPRAWCLRYARS